MFHQRNKKPQIYSHKKTESKIFTTEPTLKIGCEILRGPTKGSAHVLKVKFMQWSVIFQNKRLAIFVLFCTLPTYCWPSYCSYVPFFGHYWHFCVFWFPKKLSWHEINIFKEVWFDFFLNLKNPRNKPSPSSPVGISIKLDHPVVLVCLTTALDD